MKICYSIIAFKKSYNLLNMAYYVRPAVTPIGAAKSVVDMLVRALHKVR